MIFYVKTWKCGAFPQERILFFEEDDGMKKSLVRFLCLVMAALMALGCVSALAEEDDFSGKITISLYSAKGV